MNDAPKFSNGDLVMKISGAKFWGQIVSEPYETPLNNGWHYDVCAIHPDFFGTTHIMIESQIKQLAGAQCEQSNLIPVGI